MRKSSCELACFRFAPTAAIRATAIEPQGSAYNFKEIATAARIPLQVGDGRREKCPGRMADQRPWVRKCDIKREHHSPKVQKVSPRKDCAIRMKRLKGIVRGRSDEAHC